jgi:hypothetical protein
LELQKVECKPPQIGEEKSLAIAVHESIIANLPELEPLKQVLRYCMVLVGLREKNWPKDAEKSMLIDFIKRTYPGHTCSEIRLAFEMAIAGKLEVEVNHYENFSVLYVSSIMNAYRKWAKEAINHAVKEVPIELPAPEISDADFIEAVYQSYKLTQRMQTIPELAYKTLEPVLALTREKKEEIRAKIDAGCDADVSQDTRKMLCKQFAVASYFENHYKK